MSDNTEAKDKGAEVVELELPVAGAIENPIEGQAELEAVVSEAARAQLAIVRATATMNEAMEVARVQFAESTREVTGLRDAAFERIAEYCQRMRAAIFPKKGKTQIKTLKVLEHDLRFRKSRSVEAAKGAEAALLDEIANMETDLKTLVFSDGMKAELVQRLNVLKSLVGVVSVAKLDKVGVKGVVAEEEEAGRLAESPVVKVLEACGVRVVEGETFALAFRFAARVEGGVLSGEG